MIKRLKPYLGVGLAAWVASTCVLAQGDFYIELRGPESTDGVQTREPDRPTLAPRPVQQNPALQTRPIQQIGTGNTPAPQAPATGRYGPVRSTDTLWTIAEKYTRAPVTVQQTMVALYYLNPRAFVRGNINNLQRGAQLRLPTASQARQRSAGEAQAEFSRLTRQGNRRATQGAGPVVSRPVVATAPVAQPAPQPAISTNTPTNTPTVPAAASPPEAQPTVAANGLTEPKAASNGLTTPKAAPGAVESASGTPAAAEEMALTRLQLQLMDELREQVSMSNEQLASLADNNHLLRQHLAQLSAEVAELRTSRYETEPALTADVAPEQKGWLEDLLNNPVNLALLLILPALLLLALFTLWWRNRVRRDLAAQEQALTETSMMEDERDEFDDFFSPSAHDELEQDPFANDEALVEPMAAQDIDEDAFARFLQEQQQLEEAEAERQMDAVTTEPELTVAPDVEAQVEPEPVLETTPEPEPTPEPELTPEIDEDPLFEDNFGEDVLPEDELFEDKLFEDEMFEDETGLTTDSLSNDELDDLFNAPLSVEDPQLSADEAALSMEEAVAEPQVEALAEEESALEDATPSENPAADTAQATDPVANMPLTTDLSDAAASQQDAPPARLMDDWPEPLVESMAAIEADSEQASERNSELRSDLQSDLHSERQPEPYVSVDELMADAERGEGPEPDRERKLDLELDDYANVIGQGQGIDIDIDEGGMSGQLDLARAYIEIDDLDSARELLNEALERGNAEQQRDAKKLLARLDKRG